MPARKIRTEAESREDFDEALGFLIADTARHGRRVLYARIAQHGIRGGAWYLLRALWQQDGLTQRDLAQRLGITEPSVQETLRAMEADGLVERERDTVDRRKIRIKLTAQARSLEAPLLEVADDLNRDAVADVSPAEEQQLRRLLKLVRDRYARAFETLAAAGAERGMPLDDRTDLPTAEALAPVAVPRAAKPRRA